MKKTQKQFPNPILLKAGITLRNILPKIQATPEQIEQALSKLGISHILERSITIEQAQKLLEYLNYPYISSTKFQLEFQAPKRPRPPIVSFIGHIDHGKTSLIDYFRKSSIAKREYAGITQHVGAYVTRFEGRDITIIDTPGHQAFTSIRTTSGQISDIIVLVVAINSGVQEQTRECIKFIKQNKLNCLVAFTKCDLEGYDINQIEDQLLQENLLLEKYGGDIASVQVSSKTGQGMDALLELILLYADLLSLSGREHGPAQGYILESQSSETLGFKTTLMVTQGQLNIKDLICCGRECGVVKSMLVPGSKNPIKSTLIGHPVEVIGLPFIEEVGSPFYVVPDLKTAHALTEYYIATQMKRKKEEDRTSEAEDLSIFQSMLIQKALPKIVLKADTKGSLHGLKQEISNTNTEVDIIQEGVGNINLSDLQFAYDTGATILGFNVKNKAPTHQFPKVKVFLEKTIYKLSEMLEKYLKPEDYGAQLQNIGSGNIIQIFSYQGKSIAGCRVNSGKLETNNQVNIFRDNKLVLESTITSMKIGKNTVREANKGEECGLFIKEYEPVLGDRIEGFKKISSI